MSNRVYMSISIGNLVLYFITKQFIFSLTIWNLANVALTIQAFWVSNSGIFEGQPLQLLPAVPVFFVLFGKIYHYLIFLFLVVVTLIISGLRDLINLWPNDFVVTYDSRDFIQEQVAIMYFLFFLLLVVNTVVVLYLIVNYTKTKKILDEVEDALQTYDFEHIPFWHMVQKKNPMYLSRFEVVVKELVKNLIEFASFVPNSVKLHQVKASSSKSTEASETSSQSSHGSAPSVENKPGPESSLMPPQDGTPSGLSSPVSRAESPASSNHSYDYGKAGLVWRSVFYLILFPVTKGTFYHSESSNRSRSRSEGGGSGAGAGGGGSNIEAAMAVFVDRVHKVVRQNGGVVHDVMFEKALVTFNDVRNRPNAVLDAINCVAQLSRMGTRVGGIIMRRRSLCGVVKTDAFSKFYHFDFSWEQLIVMLNQVRGVLAENMDIPMLFDSSVLMDIKYRYLTKTVDVVEWEDASSGGTEDSQQTLTISKIVKRLDIREGEEWMYQIGTKKLDKSVSNENLVRSGSMQSKVSEFEFLEKYERAWEFVKEKEFEKAEKLVEKLDGINENDVDLKRLRKRILIRKLQLSL